MNVALSKRALIRIISFLAAVLLVLPAVNLGFGGLIPHYERWAEVLSGHVDQFQFYAVFNLYPIHDLLTPVMTQVQIGSILALAVLFVITDIPKHSMFM